MIASRREIRDWIAEKGEQAERCRVPPIRQIAKEREVNQNTAMSVLRQLEREGVAERQPNRGAVIAAR